MTDIKLTTKTSGWIAVQNGGGRNSVKTGEFLAKANKAGSFQTVSFGDEMPGVWGAYAIKREYIAGFQGWAHEHGLNAAFERVEQAS